MLYVNVKNTIEKTQVAFTMQTAMCGTRSTAYQTYDTDTSEQRRRREEAGFWFWFRQVLVVLLVRTCRYSSWTANVC